MKPPFANLNHCKVTANKYVSVLLNFTRQQTVSSDRKDFESTIGPVISMKMLELAFITVWDKYVYVFAKLHKATDCLK